MSKKIEMLSGEDLVKGLIQAQEAITNGEYAFEHGAPSTFEDQRALDAFRTEILIRIGDLSEGHRMEPEPPKTIPDEILRQMFEGIDLSEHLRNLMFGRDDIKLPTVVAAGVSVEYVEEVLRLGREAGEYYGTPLGTVDGFTSRLQSIFAE